MENNGKKKVIFLGSASRLMSTGGKEALVALCSSDDRFISDFWNSDVIVTTRWWDPIITLLKLVKPGLITIFLADGHFSLLNLNKSSNRRQGKNIFESDYCDIYLLPDLISLHATSGYPGIKYSYHPNFWDNPGITFSEREQKAYDIVFVYGNDPYFEVRHQKKLFTLVDQVVERFGLKHSICHIVPKGKNGEILSRQIADPENVFVGLEGRGVPLSRNAVYLCTPSTIVWQLVAISGKVALIDIYEEDSCFHSSLTKVRNADDLEKVLIQNEEYWKKIFDDFRRVLGDKSLPVIIDETLNRDYTDKIRRGNRFSALWRHTHRDLLSSIKSLLFSK